jgi:hypothetical protein
MEEVVGLHGAEDALDHRDMEVDGSVERGGFAGKVLPDAEVFGAPGNALVEANEAGGDAACGEGLFARVDVGEEMDFDAAGEVEAALDGGVDEGGLFDVDQGASGVRRSFFERVQIVGLMLYGVKMRPCG